MSTTPPREASPPPWAALSLIGIIFLHMLGFGIIVPLLPFYAKSFDAEPWQILATERVFSAAGSIVVGDDGGVRELRGFSRSVHAFDVKGIDNARVVS